MSPDPDITDSDDVLTDKLKWTMSQVSISFPHILQIIEFHRGSDLVVQIEDGACGLDLSEGEDWDSWKWDIRWS